MEAPAIRRRGAEDLISSLPDELLHIILVRLQSPPAAARTSVLSRRWRGVWAHMPELVFCRSPAPAAPPSALHGSIDATLINSSAAEPTIHGLLDSIDAALNSYAAPRLHNLKIHVSGVDRCDLPAHRVSPWLRFASQRIAGKLCLRLHPKKDDQSCGDIEEELALPICERATEIYLVFRTEFFLRPPPTGSFSALTRLFISCGQMDGGELGRVVSSAQCPCLKMLYVLLKLQHTHDISISSESLECLYYKAGETGKLEVHAPMLTDIAVSSAAEACIVAPKLENLEWLVPYDPRRHQIAVAGRHLRSLSIMHSTCYSIFISSTRLMERFDTVSELTISLSLEKGIAGYMTFLNQMVKLPRCENLVILLTNHCGHAFAPMMFHLLRRSICIREFKLLLGQFTPSEMPSCATLDCPCLVPENYRMDDITFGSLEEIGIGFFTGSAEQEKFVELLLSRCNTVTTLKRVDFTVPFVPVSSEIMEVVQRISSMCHPNSKVQFNVHPMEMPKP